MDRSPCTALLGALVAVVTLASGCSDMGSSQDQEASDAAADFHQALARDPSEACALLAPGTLQELENSFGVCAGSLPQRHLPAAGQVLRADVYGKDAMVVLDNDVVFLARFPDGWRVTAAGCEARVDRPYNCTIKGA